MPHYIVKNPDEFRKNTRKILLDIFENEKHANNLEKGILNWTIREAMDKKVVKKWDNHFFVMIYHAHFRSVYNNLKNKKLVENVKNGITKSQEIAFMTHQEMCPEKWDEIVQSKKIRDKHKSEQTMESNTDIYTCKRCRSKNCHQMGIQTRSADEPMTIFITCLDCAKGWKE